MTVSVDILVACLDECLGWIEFDRVFTVPRRCRWRDPLPICAAHGGSPCCLGGRRCQGLPYRKNAAARPNVLAVGYFFVAFIVLRCTDHTLSEYPFSPQSAKGDFLWIYLLHGSYCSVLRLTFARPLSLVVLDPLELFANLLLNQCVSPRRLPTYHNLNFELLEFFK